jgi:hypothetical protein
MVADDQGGGHHVRVKYKPYQLFNAETGVWQHFWQQHDDRVIPYAFDLLELDREDFRLQPCTRARHGSNG